MRRSTCTKDNVNHSPVKVEGPDFDSFPLYKHATPLEVYRGESFRTREAEALRTRLGEDNLAKFLVVLSPEPGADVPPLFRLSKEQDT